MDTACFQGEQIAAHGFADGLELTAVMRRPRQGGEVDDAQQAFSLEEVGQRILLRTHGKSVAMGHGKDSRVSDQTHAGKIFGILAIKA